MSETLPASALCRHEGTIEFQFHSPSLLDRNAGSGVILQRAAGRHAFTLAREEFELVFAHASPGTGTREARLDLAPVGPATGLHIFLVWSPYETKLVIGPLRADGQLYEAAGVTADYELIVGNDGQISRAGGLGVQTAGFKVYDGAQLVLEPAAIRTWEDTCVAIETVRKATSEEGFMFEVVQTNVIVAMLVTGVEAYSQRRFAELAGEGVRPDIHHLAEAFPRVEPVAEMAGEVGYERSVAPFTGRRGINFQNYEQMKRGFKAAYGIRFADLGGITSDDLREIKKAIAHRHQVVHVSPLESIRDGRGTGNLLFANRDYAASCSERLDRFVCALHDATLRST